MRAPDSTSRHIRVVALIGPTAAGKSDCALRVCELSEAEIITADSMQMYRGMNIGTATPSVDEQKRVPHHLLDVWPIDHEASVAEFQTMARNAIHDVSLRNRLPLLVGGSGLYVRAALDDLRFPGTDPQVRARLEAEADELGAAVMHARLAKLDPGAALAIAPTNARRIVRALEVVEITGQPFTATLPDETPVFSDVRVGIEVPPEVLVQRIAERVRRMWADGFVDEVRALAADGLASTRTAARAIGYSQVLNLLEGRCDEATAIDDTITATRRFAKRQLTWFRRDPRVVWIRYDDPTLAQQVVDLARA